MGHDFNPETTWSVLRIWLDFPPASPGVWHREAGIGSFTHVAISSEQALGNLQTAVEQGWRPLIWLCPGLRSLRIATIVVSALAISGAVAQSVEPLSVPPRVQQARRFLAQRGMPKGGSPRSQLSLTAGSGDPKPSSSTSGATAVWQPLGPAAVISPDYGLVTGRVTSIAIDPADPTGNRVFVGTTGGGVWASSNAASSAPVFSPLTDAPSALDLRSLPSISIGAITVQPGGTGVILAGTGDPNDALDSYYGAGILRSADGGNTWSLVSHTADMRFSFVGEGFAGFAWSTTDPRLVVASVSQAYEATLVNAQLSGSSSAGIYYSTDAGATWSLATISDGAGQDVQGPQDQFASPNGNAATAVVWNPVRQLFIAAVRFHGYYQSTDGSHWTRLTSQPGTGLTAQICPTNPGAIGSIACPIFRGTLAVNPITGDTFAWTVDLNNQDRGLRQDLCAIATGACSNQEVAFARQWSTVNLEKNTTQGPATILNGDYDLVLSAVPAAQDTILLAGDNDLWKCSLAAGCNWRNTTNAFTCMSAHVAPYQHALAWASANPQEILLGNDSGIWRSMDAIGESESESGCSSDDASHFQNLNSGIGSLAEVESMSQVGASPYTMLAGLGANGTAGVKSASGPTEQWPQILGGEGGPVAIDPMDPSNWYVNNEAGVSIYRCDEDGGCSPSAFGTSPVVSNSDVGGDGYTMSTPAPFIVDPLDTTQLLVGTCRVWRGPVDGSSWTSANAISRILDGTSRQGYCSGDALIRTMAALPLGDGTEVIYVGMYGAANGGAILAGHVLSAIYNPAKSNLPVWQDLSLDPVINDQLGFNHYGLDISSIFIDSHDATGKTVYVTVEGAADASTAIRTVYRSTDGGAHWSEIMSNLPHSPANSIVIDPQDANTAYVATDHGVYSTRQVAGCGSSAANCWSVFGVGLPYAPITQLSAAPSTTSPAVLVAATYGRGIWQIPLWTASTQLAAASAEPASLTFASQALGTTSTPQTITITNTSGLALAVTAISASPDFSETDSCSAGVVNAGAACAVQVSFTPGQAGSISGQITISGNIAGGQITIPLSGTGTTPGLITATPGSLNFGEVQVGTTSQAQPVTVENPGNASIPISAITVTSPFVLSANACGNAIDANSDCALSITFAPAQAGPASGRLTITDSAGTQAVALSGTGAAPPSDVLSPVSLSFPATITGQQSSSQNVTLTNNGDLPLTAIAISTSAGFQASSTCGTSLAGNAGCAISVVFAPTAAGSVTGTVRVSDAIQTQSVLLSGTALQPPAIGVQPGQIAFPVQPVGQSANPIILTITNSGGAPMSNVGFQISGQAAPGFSWSASTCGATLNAGSICTVQVLFTPTTAGLLSATLTISSSTSGVLPVQVPLSGIGQAASGLSIAPSELTFTQSTIGRASAPQAATIANAGAIAATSLVISAQPPFSVTQNTCPATLAAGSSCTASIVFTPSTNGVVTGTLMANSPSFVNPASAILSGIGGAAGSIQGQPASIVFPDTGVGATSASQTVTLTNNGPVDLGVLNLFVSSGFPIASNTCGDSLAVGASCAVQVTFAPAASGRQTGTLTIASSSLATNTQIALSGMGLDFSVSAQGQSSQTVASGQTAGYAITLAPSNGSSGKFSFACTGLPTHSTCSFNPASVSVAANSTATVTVQIATGVASGTAQNRVSSNDVPLKSALLLACGVFLLPLSLRRKPAGIWLSLVLFAGVLAIASCAGAGGGDGTGSISPPNNATPAGTYSVVATATSAGVSHKVTLSLTVD